MATTAEKMILKRQRLAEAARYDALLAAAYAAANEAIRAEVAREPEDPNLFDCGFGWVTLTPGTHPFVRHCRERAKDESLTRADRDLYGTKHWAQGWYFHCPGDWSGQSVRVWRVAAQAFAEVLARALPDLTATASSRLD